MKHTKPPAWPLYVPCRVVAEPHVGHNKKLTADGTQLSMKRKQNVLT